MVKGVFRISKEDLETMIDTYKQENSTVATMLGQYLKKSLTTGTFEITRVGLLREATWASKNGIEDWRQIVSNWADLAESLDTQ